MLLAETVRRIFCYLPAVGVAAAVAVLSLIENPYMPLQQTCNDKFWHTVMYVGLAFVLMGGMVLDKHCSWRYAFCTWTISTLYGGLIELLQVCCTVSRTGDWDDWYADMIGAAVGVALVYICLWICRKTGCIK